MSVNKLYKMHRTQIEALQQQIYDKDVQISTLTGNVEALQAEVNTLTAENETLTAKLYRLEGQPIYQYALTNEDNVRLREAPDTSSYRIRELRRGTNVLVISEVINSKGETWAYVEVDGQQGYIMMQFLDLQEEEYEYEYPDY